MLKKHLKIITTIIISFIFGLIVGLNNQNFINKNKVNINEVKNDHIEKRDEIALLTDDTVLKQLKKHKINFELVESLEGLEGTSVFRGYINNNKEDRLDIMISESIEQNKKVVKKYKIFYERVNTEQPILTMDVANVYIEYRSKDRTRNLEEIWIAIKELEKQVK